MEPPAARALAEPALPFAMPVVPPAPAVLPSYLRDHRKRLRERFLRGGADAMPDYELLELLLFRAISRRDVKPLARRLLDTFGDLAGAAAASPAALGRVPGVGEAVIAELKLAHALAARLARARMLDRPVISGWDALLDYCRTTLAASATESFRVLFLDRKNRLIADEEMGRGTVDHVPVYPREVLRRALELNASALILVHNHPSGDPTPSQADIAMTATIREICAMVSITLHDHLIVGRGREISFQSAGLM